MFDEDYKDFRVYELLDSGEKEEIDDVSVERVEELFGPEEVLLLVRFDLRRIFIWKGYKSPVRNRFISSRVSAGIQSDCGDRGMHMKIVSVDAGDEPIEFLKAFNVDPYEIDDDDQPQDMYYVRNSERQKLEDEELKKKLEKKKKDKKKDGYYSPALDQTVKFGKERNKDKLKSAKKAKALKKKAVKGAVSRSTPRASRRSRGAPVATGLTEKEIKEIKKEILELDIPDDHQRVNIIIGSDLYGPQKVVSKVFGKEVEETKWDKISNVPDGKVNIEAGIIQAICEDGKVKGLMVLNKGDGKIEVEKKPKKESKKEPKKEPKKEDSKAKDAGKEEKSEKPKKRELKPIPKGE